MTGNSYPDDQYSFKFGSSVSARSVKVLNVKIASTERDSWWAELREEITASALSINCDAILGYREYTSIYEDVLIMSISGTAVKLIPFMAV